MAPQYLLPCEKCEHQFEIVTKQAGQSLECPKCKHQTEAPKLRVMRQLEPAAATDVGPQRTGNRLKNYLFSIGLAVTILAGAAGGGLYQYANSLIFEYDIADYIGEMEARFDQLSPAQVVAVYESMNLEQGLGDWQEHPQKGSNKQGKYLLQFSYFLLGLAGLGGLTLLSSFFIKQ